MLNKYPPPDSLTRLLRFPAFPNRTRVSGGADSWTLITCLCQGQVRSWGSFSGPLYSRNSHMVFPVLFPVLELPAPQSQGLIPLLLEVLLQCHLLREARQTPSYLRTCLLHPQPSLALCFPTAWPVSCPSLPPLSVFSKSATRGQGFWSVLLASISPVPRTQQTLDKT